MTVMHFAQGFRKNGCRLVADTPSSNPSSDAAIEAALRLAPACAGAWAYSQNVDVETDSSDRPAALVKIGALPPWLEE
jgi:hypothetical protein